MDYERLIRLLRGYSDDWCEYGNTFFAMLCEDAAVAIEKLLAERDARDH